MVAEPEFASSCLEGNGLRRETEMLARRRRAARLEVAMLAVDVGKMKVGQMDLFTH